MPPAIASVAQVRARVDTDLGDAELEELILTNEALLAELIGPLTGPITERHLWPALRWGDPVVSVLRLRRFTTSAAIDTVTDAGVLVGDADWLFVNGRLHRATGAFAGPVDTVYTPNDEERLRAYLIEACRWDLVDPTVESETIGSYRYATGGRITPADIEDAKDRALARALPPRGKLGTIRVLSATSDAFHAYADPRVNAPDA